MILPLCFMDLSRTQPPAPTQYLKVELPSVLKKILLSHIDQNPPAP